MISFVPYNLVFVLQFIYMTSTEINVKIIDLKNQKSNFVCRAMASSGLTQLSQVFSGTDSGNIAYVIVYYIAAPFIGWWRSVSEYLKRVDLHCKLVLL